jgi:hypothetical protein
VSKLNLLVPEASSVEFALLIQREVKGRTVYLALQPLTAGAFGTYWTTDPMVAIRFVSAKLATQMIEDTFDPSERDNVRFEKYTFGDERLLALAAQS